jgi:hypothetical protein
MARCGCSNTCNCLIEDGTGTTPSGSGNINNPYRIDIDGPSLAGDGIGWVGNRFVARLAPGGGLEFDTTGALRTSEGGDGGDTGGATVAALENVSADLVGGALGAGFMIKPPDLLSSYRYGLQSAMDFLHVPVRFLSDGSPVVHISETMDWASIDQSEHVQDQDGHRWKVLNTTPGHDIDPPDHPGLYDPKEGWWGYLEPGQRGLTLLSDVFREVGGKIVLLLDVRFPARDTSGNFLHATPVSRTDAFLRRIRDLIKAFSLTTSVIITSTETSIPGQADVLGYFSSAGITVGPYLEHNGAADAHPPDGTWPSTWTWVFCSAGISRDRLEAYVAKPLRTVLFIVTRQYQRMQLVNSPTQTPGATGVGAVGVISADPEYYGGATVGRPLSGYPYRRLKSTWWFTTITHGLLPPGDPDLINMNWAYRGHHLTGYTAMWFGRLNRSPTPSSITGWSLQGWMGPNETPTSWSLDLGLGFDQRTFATGWMAAAFGMATDHGFHDTDPASPPAAGDPVFALDSGYVLRLSTAGDMTLIGYDQGIGTVMATRTKPIGSPVVIGDPGNPDPNRGVPQYYRIGVNANGIKVSVIPSIGGALGALVFEVKTSLAKAHRGGYIEFGRFCTNNSVSEAWNGFIDNPQLSPNGGPPNGPTA